MKDEQAIRDLIQTWFTATRSGDIATVLSLMSDDVIFMVPGQEPFGKNEFALRSREMKDVDIEGTSDIQELQVLGDWAWMRSRIEVSMKTRGAKPIRRSGYALTILRKKPDGNWVITRDANLLTTESGS